MNWVVLQMEASSFVSTSPQQSFSLSQPPPPKKIQSDRFDLNSKISPSILLIIIILAIIVFISGLVHLLVRFLLRPQIRQPEDSDIVTALQGQLQQLFHLHDAGVDQSFIDTLPVFHYKAIIGLKNPSDCAVCLCEFEPEDKLRLLPRCSHAFHMECIDIWLLSHSTCPLCRASLLSDFSQNRTCSPIVLVLESGSESSREIVTNNGDNAATVRTNAAMRSNSHLSSHGNNDFGSTRFQFRHKSCEITRKYDFSPDPPDPVLVVDSGDKVVTVKLGKFKNIDSGEGGSTKSSNNNANARRCFSMGSFEYVMDEDTFLQVPITMEKSQPSKKKSLLPLSPGHRLVKSVCDCESRREFKFNGFESIKFGEETKGNCSVGESKINENDISKKGKESFSISKIWLRGKKEKQNVGEEDSSARRAFSFRFPVNQNIVASSNDDTKEKSINGELDCDDLDSLQAKTPAFARTTLLWFLGKQNRGVNSSSFTSNL